MGKATIDFCVGCGMEIPLGKGHRTDQVCIKNLKKILSEEIAKGLYYEDMVRNAQHGPIVFEQAWELIDNAIRNRWRRQVGSERR